MKKLLLALALSLCWFSTASAGTTIVEDFRGTPQTVTATGVQTVSLGANTTIVRFNSSSDIYVVGMDGGYDGRVVLFINAGAGNALFYNEHTSASSTPARMLLDSNTGYRTLYNNSIGSFGIGTYDNTTQRWRIAILGGFNTGGPLAVNGDFSVAGNAAVVGALSSASAALSNVAGVLLTLKSLTSGNNGATVRWLNSSGTSLFTMGPDYNGNGGQNFWLYDNVNARTFLYLDNTGTSYLSFGTSYGGFQYAESTDELGFYASGLTRLRLTGNAFKIGTHPYYQKRTSGTTNTSISCEGSGEAMGTDAMDARGSFTTGTGGSGQYDCTMTFGVPWDLSVNVGKPICTANTSDPTVNVAVTAIDDHTVTFSLASPANVTVYYHCDGLIPAP